MSSFRHSEAVMGTMVNFEIRRPPTGESPAAAVAQAVAWLHWVDATFSTYKHDSEISRLDRGDLTLSDCQREVVDILELCDDLKSFTGGYFDASASGHLDPSGVVKGWSIECASALLVSAGWLDHLVEGGGDIRTHGSPGGGAGPEAWQVGITHPFRLDALCAVVRVGGGAVATSGIYERGLHVVDPHRHAPATDLASVTVVGAELVRTDAYATAALAMGDEARDWLSALDGYEALVIDAVGRGWETPGFARYRLTEAGF
jgi:thiamine biosynthesis lipoprotein